VAIHHHPETGAQTGPVQKEVDILRFGIAGNAHRCTLVVFQEPPQPRHQHFFDPVRNHLPVQLFLRLSASRYLLWREMPAKEIADDIVVALTVHPLEHGFGSLQSVAAVEDGPRFPVHGVGIDDYAIHIE